MNEIKVDFTDLEKVINEITKKHYEKIKDNENFHQLLSKLAKSNDEKNAILEEMVETDEAIMKYTKNLSSIVKLIDSRLSTLEIAVQHIEKGNKKWLELIDNLQGQVDILATKE